MAKLFVFLVIFLFIGVNMFAQEEDLLPSDLEYTSENVEDPFFPAIKEEIILPKKVEKEEIKELPLPNLIIKGIVWGTGLPQAIINNIIVKVGDVIEGVKIIDINKEGVKVEFNRRDYFIPAPASTYNPKEEEGR